MVQYNAQLLKFMLRGFFLPPFIEEAGGFLTANYNTIKN